MSQSKSPAVTALEQEQSKQRRRGENELDAGLKATFPASDPVSATFTSVPASGQAPKRPRPGGEVDAPLVDIALASVHGSGNSGLSSLSPDEELAALRAELARINESVAEIGSASLRILGARGEDLIKDARERIRTRPIPAIGYALLAGFVYGIIR